jgi:hypothetical protein
MMKLVTAILLLAIGSGHAAIVTKVQPLTTECGPDNRIHTLGYNVTTYDDSHFYNLDGHDFDELESAHCNNDGTYVKLVFHTEGAALKYSMQMSKDETFLTDGKKWGCLVKSPKTNKTSVLSRRVVEVKRDGQALDLRTTFARYDELYQEADISYASNGKSCDYAANKDICIGFNTDCKNGATQPLPLYSNQHLTITCSECYLGYDVDVFMEVTIKDWTLHSIQAGYKNMTMSGAFIITAVATAGWSAGVDKVIELVNDASLVNFRVGPVPFHMTLDVPVAVSTDLQFEATAQATFGAESIWNIGDHYVAWDPKHHWYHVTPDPKLVWSAKVRNASANFDAVASLTVAPSIAMHIDTIFTYRARMTPTLTGEVSGGTVAKQVCAKLSYDLAIEVDTELDIAIPVVNVNDDWVWHHPVYDSGEQVIAQKCTSP